MRPSLHVGAFLTVFSLLVAGCGGGGEPSQESDGGSSEGEATTAMSEPAGTATVSGTVHFQGTPPERQPLNLDRECAAMHDEPVLSQNVVVNDNGTLRWVFVYVKEGLGDRTFTAPSEPVEIDQKGCMYHPHVFGIQTGQDFKILNSDPLLHNIHALPENNRPFNFGMPNQGGERDQMFRVSEVMVRIKCDVHAWMQAYVGVLDHPYFATTGEDGTFSIEGLPAGDYTIEAWHEEYGTATQTVTVADGGSATVDFTFGPDASSGMSAGSM